MNLGKSLTIGEHCYPMVGALPVEFGIEKRPQGHGYICPWEWTGKIRFSRLERSSKAMNFITAGYFPREEGEMKLKQCFIFSKERALAIKKRRYGKK